MVDAAIISGLLTNVLAPLIKDEFSSLWNFRKEVKNLSFTLSSIDAVLQDAEKKTVREKNKQTEDWLRKLKHVAYEVRDIMDELTLEDLRLQVKRLNAFSSTQIQVTNSCFSLPLCNIWTHRNIVHKIKEVQEKLEQISHECNKLHLCESNHNSKSAIRPQTTSKQSEKVYGREREEEKIVDILVHSSNVTKEVSVQPILGLGGLGKTTLAQLVFNNKDVTDHFDLKFWVCVSEEFDIKLIIKAIIGGTDETLEILQNRIQDKLKGKRYLLVLDDVWNENDEQWKLLRSILNCGSNGAFILTTTRKKIVAEIMKTVEIFDLSPISKDDCWLLLEERAFMYGILKTVNFIGIGKEIATKCKGVPLVAKTLGCQLGFKNDEKEWCRIRDSEMWEISENEESILPILRLSYFDLPYYLRRCFAFCAIFPKDTHIDKERLIKLWMAHDLIPSNKNQELEDNGNIILDELCWRSFFQEENLNEFVKMHDLMHDLAQSVMKDECYMLDDKSSSKELEREIRHVTIMVDEYKELPFASLENKGGLQSIILHSKHFEIVSKVTFSALKKLSSLRIFEAFTDVQSLDLRDVGCLKHLRYLSLSGNKMIKILPNSICDLLNLQTLNLDCCYNLESLPRNTKDLINLRHLHLKGCRKLKYMPRKMGQLKHLKTLSWFVIGKKSDCQLDELKKLNIRGDLEIRKLENICDASIARGISMSKKLSLNWLQLYWEDEDDKNNSKKNTRHEKISEALEVPTICVKRLRINGYKGVKSPKWVGVSSASLTHLWLEEMDNVQHIFTMNSMNTSCEIGMLVLFPLLEELRIKEMKNLRELVSPPPIPITTTGAFPNLSMLYITDCPKLGALPPYLKSLNDVSIEGECSDELLHSISNLSGLRHLLLSNMLDRSVLFPEELAAAGGESERTRGLTNLKSLNICGCPELILSVEQWRNLTHSLQFLRILACPKLVPSKVEEADEVIALLHSLQARLGFRMFRMPSFQRDYYS